MGVDNSWSISISSIHIVSGCDIVIIDKWKEEAQVAFSEYKKRDCGHNIYKKDTICRRCEYAIINAYLDFLCLTRGPKVAGNHRRYVNRGENERKDEVQIVVREWNLS